MSRPSYQELEKRIRELEDEALIHNRIEAELLEKQSILRNQNISLVKRSIQLSEVKRELDDKNYDLELSQSELEIALKKLQESSKRFRDLAELLPQPVFELDVEGNATYTNRRVLETFGYTHEDLEKGLNLFQMFIPEVRQRVKQHIQKGLTGEQFEDHEYIGLRKDGSTFPLLIYMDAIIRDNRPVGVRGIILDITILKRTEEALREARDELEQRVVQRTAELIKANEQLNQEIENHKQTEKALRESETFSSSLLDNSPIPILVINPDSSIKYVNPSLEKLTGFSYIEIIGRKAPYPWWTEKTLETTSKDLEKAMREGAQGLGKLFQKKNGERFWVEITSVPIRKNGELKYYFANWIDITKRKQAEEKLFEALRERENIMETIPDIIYVLDTNGKLIRWNDKLKVFTGLSPEELMCRDALEFFEEDKEFVAEAIREVFEKGQVEVEARIIRKDGTAVPYYWTGALLKDAQGNAIGITGVGRDITERKQAEQALQKSEKKYRTLLETTSEGWWLLNPELKIIEVNQAICNMLGYSQDEILGKTPFDFADDEDRKIFIEQSSKIPTAPHRSFEITLKKKNGEDLYACFNASTIRDESGDIQGAFALITDITERKQTQEERDRLAITIEQSAESVFITGRDGTIQYINPAFERLTGYSRKDAIGQNPRILKSGKHDALFYKEMWDTLTRGDVWHGRLINKKKDGSLYKAEATISPVLDTSGKITNFVSIKRDVTYEIELEKQLIQSQKMEAIGTLAGGIAHDFNNILTAIIGYAGLALIEAPKETRLYDDVQEILHAGHRAKDLVRQILTFSRKSEEEKAPVQIRHIVKEALKFLRSSLPATIEIREEIAGETGIVNANPTQMHQVIMNLCTNASQAMQKKGGILEVGLRNVDLDSRSAARYPDIDPGTYLKLTVSDTGEGMTPDVKKRIFEPYFTTKEKGVGTGMGLSVVHGIVKSHKGTITVYGEPGKGSTFHVYIPLIQEEVKRPEIDKSAFISTGTEHILFIDDEPVLVDMGKRIFERLGYEVTSRTSSVEALELFKARPDRFDLVITDMTMPNMMGDELARELMKIRPDIPVILCTGYSERVTEKEAKRIGIKAFVMKPFIMRDLANTVKKVLDRN